MKSDSTETPTRRRDFIEEAVDNNTVRNFAIVGSLLVGLGTAVASIWREHYDEIKHASPFKEMRKHRQDAEDVIRMGMDKGLLAVEEGRAKLHEVGTLYTKQFKSALDRQGISRSLIQGTFDRVHELGKNNLGEIAMKTGASLVITIGAYLLVNQNVKLKINNDQQDEKMRQLRDKIDAQEARHSAERA